nr:hypothetical protein CFP56_41814 [Quercus suber]
MISASSLGSSMLVHSLYLYSEPKRIPQEPVPRPVVTTPTNRWCPPDQHCYKANYDSAVFKSSNTAGLSVVIRDSRGDILGAISVRVPLPHSVPEVEALACRYAVSFAIDLGLHKVIFEGDSTIITQAINSGAG